MELFGIKERLTKYDVITIGNQDLNIDIRLIKLLVKEQRKYHKHIIYLGSVENLPSPSTAGEFTILCFGKPFNSSLYKNVSFRILYLKSEDLPSVSEIFNTIQDALLGIQQINSGLHMLINSFFQEQGLQYLLDTAYEVFGNPLFVIDNSYKYIAVSSGLIADTVFASEENKNGYISDEGIKFIRDNKFDELIRKQNAPISFMNPYHNKCMMADSITINNIEVGHIMSYELDQKFSEFDNVLLHRIGRIISMELQKNSFFNANKGIMYSYFLADLLDNPEHNYSSVKERLALMGYQLHEDQYILTIPSRSYYNSEAKLSVIVNQLHLILQKSIYTIYQNCIVVLISYKRSSGINEFELQKLLEFLDSNQLVAGMSNFFENLQDARRFYLQSLKAIELGEKLLINQPIYYYSDYYIFHIFEMCEKEEEIRFFIHPSMMKLRYYDLEHKTDFLNTLHEYLESPGQPTQISKRLHIHKNTLLYRMDKIRTIMDCALESGDEYMTMGLSYKIMKYLKML